MIRPHLLAIVAPLALLLPGTARAENCLGPIPVAGRVLAVDTKTGKVTELYRVEKELLSAPAVGDCVLYAGVGYELRAIDLKDGRARWTFKAPLPVHETVVTPAGVFCGGWSFLSCLDPANGRVRWKYQGEHSVMTLFPAGDVLLASTANTLRAFDPRTGVERWQAKLPEAPAVLSRASDTEVCAWAPDTAHLIDLTTGKVRFSASSSWKPSMRGRAPTNAVAADGALYRVLHSEKPDAPLEIEAADGGRRVRWQERHTLKVDNHSRLTHVAGQLLLSTGGRLAAFDAATGKEQWRFQADVKDAALVEPRRDGTTLFVAANTGDLWALDARTGKELWKCAPPPLPIKGRRVPECAPPFVSGDTVYLVVNESVLYGRR